MEVLRQALAQTSPRQREGDVLGLRAVTALGGLSQNGSQRALVCAPQAARHESPSGGCGEWETDMILIIPPA